MHKRIEIKNAIIVNEGREFLGSVLIDNDQISEIIEGVDAHPKEPALEIIDAEGMYLLPGIIDTHVHFRDPGLTNKATWETESTAAAAGGVTTVFDMPNTIPTTTTLEALKIKEEIAQNYSHVNYGLFFGVTPSNVKLLSSINPRRIAGLKLFMGASTGNMQVTDESVIQEVFETAHVPLVTHCEDNALIAAKLKELKSLYHKDLDVSFHSVIRSSDACYTSTQKAVALAKKYKTRLHVAHISTEKELKLFEANDHQITAEVCVPHLMFSDVDYKRLGTRIKCNPAIKTLKDRDALRFHLNTGVISSIATDHAPHSISDKEGGCNAASGIPSIQFSLLSILELVNLQVLSITRLVDLMCHQPARIFQIENRGFIRTGYKADLVLVRPNAPRTLTTNRIFSKCNWSPFEGKTFKYKVEKTFCNGNLIYSDGHLVNSHICGLPVTFER